MCLDLLGSAKRHLFLLAPSDGGNPGLQYVCVPADLGFAHHHPEIDGNSLLEIRPLQHYTCECEPDLCGDNCDSPSIRGSDTPQRWGPDVLDSTYRFRNGPQRTTRFSRFE